MNKSPKSEVQIREPEVMAELARLNHAILQLRECHNELAHRLSDVPAPSKEASPKREPATTQLSGSLRELTHAVQSMQEEIEVALYQLEL